MTPEPRSAREVAADRFAQVRQLGAQYRALADSYDTLLMKAHNAGHGATAAASYLRAAVGMAPAMVEALKRYQEAVAALVDL
jgi:hypothetical protein